MEATQNPLFPLIEEILIKDTNLPRGTEIGESKSGIPINGYHFGEGDFLVSLIGGCHADEPVGPILLKKLVHYFSELPFDNTLMRNYSWYIVPHVNPDGELRNRTWYEDTDKHIDPVKYIEHVHRELPGEDVEFGFPIEGKIGPLRPENEAIYSFWRSAGKPFHLHASLHSMAYAYGPWFLIDQSWQDRSSAIQEHCSQKVRNLGYRLHDVDRKGEKGFHRIAEGFCTRPDSNAMKSYFKQMDKPEEVEKFHPSSMESIRSLGGDCLTLVSEMPLFLLPPERIKLEWPSTQWQTWREKFQHWRKQMLIEAIGPDDMYKLLATHNIKPMPIEDQMRLQWAFITSGIMQVVREIKQA